jgi:hypothetical protein
VRTWPVDTSSHIPGPSAGRSRSSLCGESHVPDETHLGEHYNAGHRLGGHKRRTSGGHQP